jgi:hypothetical protein
VYAACAAGVIRDSANTHINIFLMRKR